MSFDVKDRYSNCVWCGNKLAEHFFSGSYETYMADCNCEARKRWGEAQETIDKLEKLARQRLRLQEIETRIVELKNEVDHLKKEGVTLRTTLGEGSDTSAI